MFAIVTNVASEIVRVDRVREPQVISKFPLHDLADMYLTAVNEAELLYGIAIMPIGRRRSSLQLTIERWLEIGFRERILPFDDEASRMYAQIAAIRRSAGKPIAVSDCQIAAITRARDAILVTRNIRDFEDTGIEVVNPWVAS